MCSFEFLFLYWSQNAATAENSDVDKKIVKELVGHFYAWVSDRLTKKLKALLSIEA